MEKKTIMEDMLQMRIIEKITWVTLVMMIAILGYSAYQSLVEFPAKEAELQQCFEDGYEVTAKGVEITSLPEDWSRWSYVIDHKEKTVKFLEIRPVRGVVAPFPHFVASR